MTDFIRKRIWMILALFFIIVYLSPLLILGKDAHVRVHDQLDSTVVWYKILADSGKIFAANDAPIPNIMNGLPRESLGSQFKLWVLLFVWFPPFVAYTINAALLRLVAFFGMYLLLTKHVLSRNSSPTVRSESLPDSGDAFIKAGASLCFALLPFWLPGCLSIAGIPLATYAFLNFRKREATQKDWLIIVLLPFASSFILSFFFFLAVMGVIWLIDWVKTRHSNWRLFSAIAIMTAVYLAKDYRLVLGVLLGHGFTPHRVEFDRGHSTLVHTLKHALLNFAEGQTHTYTIQYVVILWVALFFFFWAVFKWFLRLRAAHAPIDQNEKKLVIMVFLTGAFALWYNLWYWQGLFPLKATFKIAREFNFARLMFLNPILWYLIFAVCLVLITTKWKRAGKPIAMVLLAIQLVVLFKHNHEPKYRGYDMPSWREFYSPKLFHSIQDFIGLDPSTYRVVSIGIHPSISQYSGFYTLDSYVTLYPLEYKHKFRQIIAPELAKNKTLRSYFDDWGSRCYIFVDELGKNYFFYKSKHKIIHHLDLNTKAMKNMGGKYILSAVKIANARDNHLKLLHIFENQVSIWRIYLYQVT
ncbi:MAG TPA: DUF6044 family protein [Bacillales bacterium]|nr:DUF6044 family protein [Bacillales bacterium]